MSNFNYKEYLRDNPLLKEEKKMLSEEIHETEMVLEGVLDTLKTLGAKSVSPNPLALPVSILKGAFSAAKGIFNFLKGKKGEVKDKEISAELEKLDTVAGGIVGDLDGSLKAITGIVNRIASDAQVEETVPDEFFEVLVQLVQALRTAKQVALKIEKGDPAAK